MSELAAGGIPVAVSLRVLKLSRQPYYRWRHQQVTKAEVVEAYRANALLDAHRDDPASADNGIDTTELLARELGATVIEDIPHS